MLLVSSAIVGLGAALVCLGMGDSIWRLSRAVTVVGGFIAAALMLDLADPRRDRTLLPVVSLLAGCGLILLWQLDARAASRQVVWMLTGAGLMVAVYYLIADVRDLSRHKYTTCPASSTWRRWLCWWHSAWPSSSPSATWAPPCCSSASSWR